MPGGEETLISQRPSSELSNDRSLAEEDALLTGQPREDAKRQRWQFWRQIGLFV
ncbi:hypothetical protein LTS18_003829, partial [Coniosporium uncinatum]